MRKAATVFVVVIAAAVVAAGLLSRVGNRPHGALPSRSPAAAPSSPLIAEGSIGAARQLAAAGRVREAQDVYLQLLLINPTDAEATDGLVAVRRRLAGSDPATLRRQAAAYEQAIALGKETGEHYTAGSMKILALASIRAADEIEAAPGHAPRQTHDALAPNLPPPAAPRSEPSSVPSRPSNSAPTDRQALSPQPRPSQIQSPPPQGSPPSRSGTRPTAPGSPPTTSPATSQPPTSEKAVGGPSRASPDIAPITVPVPSPDPAMRQDQGDLVKVDCQARAFLLRGPNGDQEYLAAANILIFVRSRESERLPEFCGLQRFLGHPVIAWSRTDGDRRIARWVSVVLSGP